MSTETPAKQTSTKPTPKTRAPRHSTPQRQIRVPDEDFYGAVVKAKGMNLQIGEVTSRLLRAWRQGDIELPN